METMNNQINSLFTVSLSPQLDLKLNIENSLLEAISTELPYPEEKSATFIPAACYSTVDLSTIDGHAVPKNPQLVTHPHDIKAPAISITKDTVQAFNFSGTLNNIARSTPFRRVCVNQGLTSSSSQVNPDEALALLENSTIHLDASTLLDDEPTTFAPSTSVQSVIFTGCSLSHLSGFHKSADLFTFETKLSLGGELDDVIKPTQISENVDVSQKDGFSTASNSSFDSQINWSPIEQMTETLNTRDILYSSSPIRENNTLTTSKNYSVNPASNKSLSGIFQESSTESSMHDPLSKGKRTKENNYIDRKFFLSQAECTNHESSDQLHSKDQDIYDDSFINDDSENGTCNSPGVNTSDMMKVDLIFSQIPEEDEYQLDSFYVDDDESLIFNGSSKPPTPKLRRRRIRTGTQIQQSFF
ncbi:unnamed protein product [Heterobilharzia americana]|nr:unnamed protein product [Heterobilharzia americana]